MTLVARATANLPSVSQPMLVAACLCAAVALSAAVAITGLVAVLVVLVLAAGVAAVVWPNTATVLFLGVLYANLPAVASRYYGLPATLAAGSIGVLGLPLVAHLARRQPLVLTSAIVPLLGYLGVVLLSAAVAGYDSTEAVIGLLSEGFVLYVLVTNVVRTTDTLRHVVWALVIAGGLMGAVTVQQELTHSYTSEYGGLGQVEVDTDANGNTTARAAGPVGEKNRYAQVLLVLLPLAVWLTKDQRRVWLRAVAIGAGILILAGVLLTFSRGASVAIAVMLLAMIGLGFVRPRIVLPVIVGLVAVTLIVAPGFIARVQSIGGVAGLLSPDAADPDGAILGRATSGLAAFNVFIDHPILGVGPGQYAEHYSIPYANRLGLRHFDEPRRAHDLFVEVAAETGVPGLVAFLGVFVLTVRPLWRLRRFWRKRREDLSNLATAMLISVLGYMVAGLFLHLAYQRYLWLLLALANSAIWILARERRAIAAQAHVIRTPLALVRARAS